MPTQSTPIKDFFVGLGLLIGGGVVVLLLWLIPLGVLAGLIYLGLSLFTDWSFIPKFVISILASCITLFVLGLLSDTYELFGVRWLGKKPTPCPHCGKNLRTALAKQCRHCGADWHSES
ncbi:MAG: hypothetical protein H8E44_29495 [Planctomycetes bacterium]|nr:hypothetical protein [Planctomycetota bacterium]MBL7044166.1 hypothetical protein [Pirellulaceae bacterium]